LLRNVARSTPVAHVPMLSGRIPEESDRVKEEFYQHDSNDDQKVEVQDVGTALRGVAGI
jgi:hypothetical protein